jgi:hypothetical protein
MKRFALWSLAALVLAAAPAGAQEHFTEGPVWEVARYRVKPDRFDAYMKWARQNWLPRAIEYKKQGLTLDYKVFFNTARRDEKDWDIAFAVLYPSYGKALDYSSADESKFKEVEAKFWKTKDEEKQRELAAPRLDFREYVGTEYIREVTMKPMP